MRLSLLTQKTKPKANQINEFKLSDLKFKNSEEFYLH